MATSMVPVDSTTLIDTDFRILRRVPSSDHGGKTADPAARAAGPQHVNVNRATLRQIVCAGLDDVCHFNARLERYESDSTGVTARFTDGRTVRGDVLVGADGVRSAVRRQRAPHARLMDSGIRALYARLPLEVARRSIPAHALEDVFTVGADARRVFLGLGPVIFPARPDEAASRLAPESQLHAQDDYVVSIVGGRQAYFGKDDATLRSASSSNLLRVAADLLRDWPIPSACIPAHADPGSFFYVEMYSSVPCELGAPGNVTLLGDAVHAPTPTLGRGANIAMRDAALLGRTLMRVEQGRVTLAQGMAAYEEAMTRDGFGVVRASARMGERLMGELPLPEQP